jgi:aminopeptidase
VSNTFEQKLEKYADVLIRVGLNLRAGQRLFLRAPIEAAPFVRLITQKAYQAGARLVDVSWNDEQILLTRMQYAPHDSFEESSTWLPDAIAAHIERGDAYMAIAAGNPELLSGQDPENVATVQQIAYKNAAKQLQLIQKNVTNWLVASIPVGPWSAKVLPNVPEAEREAKMWDVIFEMCRIEGDDPVAGWWQHVKNLDSRSDYLNQKQYATLKYSGPGTDLTLGLPKDHIWLSGGITAKNGVYFTANVPTEEVFTMPHKDKVNGTVWATKPLNLQGTLIENFSVTFENGRVVKATAEKGEVTLNAFLDTDEGARRLGEVALVPHSSPISQSGLTFFNTLYDENASSHLALGSAYNFTLKGGTEMNDDQFLAAGGNRSITHVDFMIGSEQFNVDGVTEDGAVEPILRGGEWAF